jgi:hypothetical protein
MRRREGAICLAASSPRRRDGYMSLGGCLRTLLVKVKAQQLLSGPCPVRLDHSFSPVTRGFGYQGSLARLRARIAAQLHNVAGPRLQPGIDDRVVEVISGYLSG